jgi:hypothetical protein
MVCYTNGAGMCWPARDRHRQFAALCFTQVAPEQFGDCWVVAVPRGG